MKRFKRDFRDKMNEFSVLKDSQSAAALALALVGALSAAPAAAQPGAAEAEVPDPVPPPAAGPLDAPASEAPPAATPVPVETEPQRLDPAPVPPDLVSPAVNEPVAVTSETEKSEEKPPVVRASNEGFSLSSDDKAFVLKLRGYVQADARVYLDDVETPPPHSFLLRRVRPIFEGTLYEYFGFRVMPDFGGGQTVLQDAYLDVRPLKEESLRFGKFKAPFGLERLQSATNLVFVERAFPTQLAPNRDVGVQLSGEIAGGALSYAIGIFNGVPDGGSTDADLDEHKDLTARIFAHPLRPFGIDAFEHLGLGVAVSTGTAEGSVAATAVPQYRSSGQQAIFRYRAVEGELAETAVADGRRNRVSPQLYYYVGPIGLLAEYALSANRIAVGDASRLIENQAWQIAGTFVIGGTPSFEGVKPQSAVGEGGVGAFDLSLRYQGLRIDDDAFPTYADPARSTASADSVGVGIGWWANRAARFLANFETTSFEGGAAEGADRPSEKIVLFRSQVSW